MRRQTQPSQQGTAAQYIARPHNMDVHNRLGEYQNGARLPEILGRTVKFTVTRYWSRFLCRTVVFACSRPNRCLRLACAINSTAEWAGLQFTALRGDRCTRPAADDACNPLPAARWLWWSARAALVLITALLGTGRDICAVRQAASTAERRSVSRQPSKQNARSSPQLGFISFGKL